MLDELHVRNVALIRDARFAPCQGLTVVTGETGAGKTALLSALKLLVGERADASAVREGAQQAEVEGRFFLSGDTSDDGIVARRTVNVEGRSRVSVNGSMATVGQLADRLGSTVDLCGQHEHQHLLKASNHAGMLDAWAGEAAAAAKAAYAQAFDAHRAATEELARIQEASQASSEALDQARFVLARIDEASPSVEEYEQLMADLPRIENGEALAQATDAAYQALSADGAAIDSVNSAINALEGMVSADPSLGNIVSALTDASYVLEDASRDVRSYRDGIEHDPAALQQLQERASTLQSLMRSYGPRMEDVIARRDEAATLIESVDDSTRLIAQAQGNVQATEADLVQAAQAFDDVRRAAAPKFSELVNAQLSRLQMAGAQVSANVEPLPREQWTRAGSSKVEFMYQAAENMTPRPLSRIASGGEVSRVMLACKVVLGAADERETLVFDEVDAGVGGSAAVSLAAVLADLAKTHQVICVTHLAQVAVYGDAHYVVRKNEGAAAEDGLPETTLTQVAGEDRVLEVARMLSGDTGEASRAHAQELLASVGR